MGLVILGLVMGRVFVAGSINMDVVATADRHPKVGETVAGKAVLYFPGGKGANQAVAAAKLGAPTTLIGRLGTDSFGRELRRFSPRKASTSPSSRRRPRRTPEPPSSPLPMPTTPLSSCPAPMRWSNAEDVAAPVLAKGDVAVSQFEIPLPTITAFFKRARAVGATTILNPAPAIAFGQELLDLVDILILNETELGFLTGTELRDTDDHARFIEAARSLQMDRRQDRLRDVGQARDRCANRWASNTSISAAQLRPSTPPAPATALSARSRHCSPMDNPFRALSATPISPPPSA